jgi:hypothetical protein
MEERSVLPKLMELKSLFLSILQETPKYKKSRQKQLMHYSHSEKESKERNTNEDLPPHEGSSSIRSRL